MDVGGLASVIVQLVLVLWMQWPLLNCMLDLTARLANCLSMLTAPRHIAMPLSCRLTAGSMLWSCGLGCLCTVSRVGPEAWTLWHFEVTKHVLVGAADSQHRS